MKDVPLNADFDSRIRSFLEDMTSEKQIRLWTKTLTGFQPLKRDEMLREFGDRLPVLKGLNDFVERVSAELKVSRRDVREGIRCLQGKYGLRVNYNQVKDAALRQLIKYSMLQEEKGLSQGIADLAPPNTSEMPLEATCLVIHEILDLLPLYDFRTPMRRLPRNGVYFFFEQGEFCRKFEVIRPRIARVGTHRKQDRFRSRIRQHFRGNKNGSVFRKHLGGALLRRRNIEDSRLDKWLRQNTPTFKEVEEFVDNELAAHFTFKCVTVADKKERLDLEERLIATLAKCTACEPSKNWLGLHAVSGEIRQSGLWNVQHTDSNKHMTQDYQSRLREMTQQEKRV
jgi:hypothetical protein